MSIPIPDTNLVSIVVVAFNNWPELELSIQSALCQSYRNIEVIVVDNSSTDGTPEAVARVFGDRVRYVRQPNIGDAGAYNTGVRLARGAFVQFLDGDDVLTPYKIESQMEVFASDPSADLVYGTVRQFQARPGRMLVTDTDTETLPDVMAAFLPNFGYYFGNTLCFLIRRSALERVGPWDQEIYVTDTDYWLRAMVAGLNFRNCPDKMMGYFAVGAGKMSSDPLPMLRGHEKLWQKASGLVTAEPYRSMVALNLGRSRLLRALRDMELSTGDALRLLAQARRDSRAAVSSFTYAVGTAVILVPGGRFAARHPAFSALRRAIGSILRLGLSR